MYKEAMSFIQSRYAEEKDIPKNILLKQKEKEINVNLPSSHFYKRVSQLLDQGYSVYTYADCTKLFYGEIVSPINIVPYSADQLREKLQIGLAKLGELLYKRQISVVNGEIVYSEKRLAPIQEQYQLTRAESSEREANFQQVYTLWHDLEGGNITSFVLESKNYKLLNYKSYTEKRWVRPFDPYFTVYEEVHEYVDVSELTYTSDNGETIFIKLPDKGYAWELMESLAQSGEYTLGIDVFEATMDTNEASQLWGLHQDHIKKLCQQGKIVARKKGNSWRILRDQPNPSTKDDRWFSEKK